MVPDVQAFFLPKTMFFESKKTVGQPIQNKAETMTKDRKKRLLITKKKNGRISDEVKYKRRHSI